jgi:hypothetical protein
VKRLAAALAAVGASITLAVLHGTSLIGGFPWAELPHVIH